MDGPKVITLEQCTITDDGPSSVDLRQWTYKEVAALKRVSVQTVMEWVKRGMVPSPVYTGFTARFTAEHVAAIMSESNRPGTYPVTPSPRSAIGKMGGSSKRPAKGKARNPAQQKRDAKPKPTLKPVSPRRKPKRTGANQYTPKKGAK